ncbi:hypothetical protein KUL42_27580 [Alteromonas sp. KUL42]|uniref:type II toxin-antitoxin system RelE/ParE family toxin n=1 Tax=Alteromonas sp. KUL42 TaxID=2480797 RepID=UPI001036D3C9|nr:type II toxin-antitoxin system RelE/ParE family toxin [Alteromonas sp. KUL42]TAP32822.1 type II toxin-antitoxin system RelE/ParE family toxin [Alteromonas sp. KUL42]GEA07997.1 hypothetical protein KUL42_27580 [Alteromonas sp. KUL42]
MSNYRISVAAEYDLTAILDYGETHFGLEQAILFYEGLASTFDKIAKAPNLYPAVDEIKEGYRRAIYETYSIYYIQRHEFVEIARIIRKHPSVF